MGTKSVFYRGVQFTRRDGRNYWEAHPRTAKKHGLNSVLLHRNVYESEVGEIPAGFHVHHIDGNAENKDVSNLERIAKSDHARLHYEERVAKGDGPGQGEAAVAWRTSEEGRAQLSENARTMHENSPEREFACADCGKSVRTKHQTAFLCEECGPKRKSARKGEGHMLYICEVCGKEYPRYRKPNPKMGLTCGYECGWVLRKRRIKESLQSGD